MMASHMSTMPGTAKQSRIGLPQSRSDCGASVCAPGRPSDTGKRSVRQSSSVSVAMCSSSSAFRSSTSSLLSAFGICSTPCRSCDARQPARSRRVSPAATGHALERLPRGSQTESATAPPALASQTETRRCQRTCWAWDGLASCGTDARSGAPGRLGAAKCLAVISTCARSRSIAPPWPRSSSSAAPS
jgi:hypothetical protein